MLRETKDPAIEPPPNERRRHPRVLSPPGVSVAWRSGSQQGVCRLGNFGLGGLFLRTPNPLAVGSTVELLFDVANGSEVRVRATVRNVKPGKGMGVKFVHMGAEHRSRLNQFLQAQLEAEKDARKKEVDAIAKKHHELVHLNNELRISMAIIQNQLNAGTVIPSQIDNTLW